MDLRSSFRVRWLHWKARFSNEARQLTGLPLRERDVVDQVMFGLKRDPELRKIIEEHERAHSAGANDGD